MGFINSDGLMEALESRVCLCWLILLISNKSRMTRSLDELLNERLWSWVDLYQSNPQGFDPGSNCQRNISYDLNPLSNFETNPRLLQPLVKLCQPEPERLQPSVIS